MRAIPEKTLEHWTSMYLARVFPHCQLWWPVKGEDVSVEHFPHRPGKSVVLEIKTADWRRQRHEHRLSIDVRQLKAYQRYMVPVYYVFPIPPWRGALQDHNPWLAGLPRSGLFDLGPLWFGNWVFVTNARTLWRWLGSRRQRQANATLFARGGGPANPSSIFPAINPWWHWHAFWQEMARCGSDDMPALMSVPAWPFDRDEDWQPRDRLTAWLSERNRHRWEGQTVARFAPDVEGYRRIEMFDSIPMKAGRATTAVVHLDAADLVV